jgi:hypothetical protein
MTLLREPESPTDTVLGSSSLISRYAGKRSVGHVADAYWNWPARPTSPYYHSQRPPLLRLVWLLSTSMYISVCIKKCFACVISFCVAHWQPLLLSISCQCTFRLPLVAPSLIQLPATLKIPSFDFVQTHNRNVIGLDRVYGPNIRKSWWLRECRIMPQPVSVCGDSISMSSAATALSEGVAACVDKALVVGGSAKRGGSRRILTSVLCVVIEYLCTSSRSC